jgi:hypothetical protein
MGPRPRRGIVGFGSAVVGRTPERLKIDPDWAVQRRWRLSVRRGLWLVHGFPFTMAWPGEAALGMVEHRRPWRSRCTRDLCGLADSGQMSALTRSPE